MFLDKEEDVASKNPDCTFDDQTLIESQLCSNAVTHKKVLGIEWDTNNDKFVFRFSKFISDAQSLHPTKRNILRIAASLYLLVLFHL